METTTQTVLTSLAVITIVLGALFLAYNAGYMDPVIEELGEFWFKAKAEAEKKKLQAQGMKAGEDFADEQLGGNKQADELKEGIGSLGGLKKQL